MVFKPVLAHASSCGFDIAGFAEIGKI